MTHSMLCLAANVGAGATDFANLLWCELRLDGDLPLYQEDRGKPAHLLGSDVPRCCPLLPETVRSLKRWRDWQPAELKAAVERAALRPAERTRCGASAAGDDGPTDFGANVFTYADARQLDQCTSMEATDYMRYLRRAVGNAVAPHHLETDFRQHGFVILAESRA